MKHVPQFKESGNEEQIYMVSINETNFHRV